MVSLSIEYPTSSVRIQYTTICVGISSPDSESLRVPANKYPKKEKIQQIPVCNSRKGRYNLAERAVHSHDPEAMPIICKHPRVRVVSRHEDAEFVECLDCGEVFDSEEFRDMEIEETVEPEEAADDR